MKKKTAKKKRSTKYDKKVVINAPFEDIAKAMVQPKKLTSK